MYERSACEQGGAIILITAFWQVTDRLTAYEQAAKAETTCHVVGGKYAVPTVAARSLSGKKQDVNV